MAEESFKLDETFQAECRTFRMGQTPILNLILKDEEIEEAIQRMANMLADRDRTADKKKKSR